MFVEIRKVNKNIFELFFIYLALLFTTKILNNQNIQMSVETLSFFFG